MSIEALAAPLGLSVDDVVYPLTALEAEGFALRGQFTADADTDEWCERRLLARIHRYTVRRLRAEIEPVAARDFLRFLFEWQRVAPGARMEGPDALAAIINQLRGLRGAGARLGDGNPAGASCRLRPGLARRSVPLGSRRLGAAATAQRPARGRWPQRPRRLRSTPITLLARRNAALWALLSPAPTRPSQAPPRVGSPT